MMGHCQFAASRDASKQIVGVHKEAVLSSGSLHSPQLLQLSGIGSSSRLGKLGIKSVVDLPGVGQNLQDHYVAPTILQSRFSCSQHRLELWTWELSQTCSQSRS